MMVVFPHGVADILDRVYGSPEVFGLTCNQRDENGIAGW